MIVPHKQSPLSQADNFTHFFTANHSHQLADLKSVALGVITHDIGTLGVRQIPAIGIMLILGAIVGRDVLRAAHGERLASTGKQDTASMIGPDHPRLRLSKRTMVLVSLAVN